MCHVAIAADSLMASPLTYRVPSSHLCPKGLSSILSFANVLTNNTARSSGACWWKVYFGSAIRLSKSIANLGNTWLIEMYANRFISCLAWKWIQFILISINWHCTTISWQLEFQWPTSSGLVVLFCLRFNMTLCASRREWLMPTFENDIAWIALWNGCKLAKWKYVHASCICF